MSFSQITVFLYWQIITPIKPKRSCPTNLFQTLIILLALLVCTGCSVVKIVDILGPDAQVLREGEKQFAQGNYHEAALLFQEAHSSNVSLQTKNAALYSLACARITVAKDDEEFIEAVMLLDKWKKSYEGGLYIENPSLMITALEKRLVTIRTKKITAKDQARANKRVENRQKQKISEMKSILKTLQHQITELEAIDQQIREKKNPL